MTRGFLRRFRQRVAAELDNAEQHVLWLLADLWTRTNVGRNENVRVQETVPLSHVDDSDVARERDAAHAMLIEVSRQLRVARAVIAVIVDQAGWYPELRVKDTIDVDAVINKYKIYLQADLR